MRDHEAERAVAAETLILARPEAGRAMPRARLTAQRTRVRPEPGGAAGHTLIPVQIRSSRAAETSRRVLTGRARRLTALARPRRVRVHPVRTACHAAIRGQAVAHAEVAAGTRRVKRARAAGAQRVARLTGHGRVVLEEARPRRRAVHRTRIRSHEIPPARAAHAFTRRGPSAPVAVAMAL